jgi:hypothetical protein
VFSATLWQHLVPAESLITANVSNGPFKWCRVDEKPAVKQFTALSTEASAQAGLIFCFFCIKPAPQSLGRRGDKRIKEHLWRKVQIMG